MSTEFINLLDNALEELRTNEPLPKILDRYPDRAEELVSLLQTASALKSIQPVETPSFDAMQMDRNIFLQEIKQLESSTVSPGLFARIKEWTGTLFNPSQISLFYQRKEKWNMNAILVRAVLVLGLMFGATGGAYAMADSSLPNEPMYGAKLAMEQVRLNMVTDPSGIATRHMAMAQNRVQEIIRLAQQGTPPDAATMTRLKNQFNLALQFAAQLGDNGEMLGLLTQARIMTQAQVQAMNRIQTKSGDPLHEPLQLTLQLLNQFQYRLEAGIQDPQAFRLQSQRGQDEPLEALEAPGQPGGNPDCPLDDCVPVGDENKYGQSEEVPPGQPGGNPDCPLDDCTPVGDENKYGQSEENPPGQPGGNPDCTCEDCVPVGDEHQYGPQPEQPGSGQPGGNPDCTDCVPDPVGDQNQKGKTNP